MLDDAYKQMIFNKIKKFEDTQYLGHLIWWNGESYVIESPTGESILYDSPDPNYVIDRICDNITMNWRLNSEDKAFCTCKESEKTGQTSVYCCNICGKPDEEFWK